MYQKYIEELKSGKQIRIKYNKQNHDYCEDDGWWSEELWCYGLLTLQLENKLSRYGIEMIKVSEAYSSQTCPHCGRRHKLTNRNYICQCGYKQHRDVVGAMNILNFNEKDVHIEQYTNLKYLRIA